MVREVYAVDLPGKELYEKEFNVTIRKITPIEQKYILSLSQKEQKTSKEYIDFIKKLIEFDNPEMTFEELFWFDVQYLLYRIRFTTYSKYPIKLTMKCDGEIENEDGNKIKCSQELKHELQIDNLDIFTPDDIQDFEKTVTLESLGEIKIRNKTIGDDLVIEKFMTAKRMDKKDFQTRLLLLDLCLISGEKSLEELYSLAENGEISAEDIIAIEKWIEKHIWGVKEEITTVCPKCGKEETRGYALSLEDFFSAV